MEHKKKKQHFFYNKFKMFSKFDNYFLWKRVTQLKPRNDKRRTGHTRNSDSEHQILLNMVNPLNSGTTKKNSCQSEMCVPVTLSTTTNDKLCKMAPVRQVKIFFFSHLPMYVHIIQYCHSFISQLYQRYFMRVYCCAALLYYKRCCVRANSAKI